MKKAAPKHFFKKKSIINYMHLVQFKFIYMEPVVSRQFLFQGKDPKLLKRKPQQSHYFKLANTW